jgi:NADPH:quinone reductase-like Zn-dependent oxidoreductase
MIILITTTISRRARTNIHYIHIDTPQLTSPDPYQILGFDAAGTVEAVGPQAEHYNFKPGDAVYFAASPIRHGSNAEFILVHAGSVSLMPSNLSFEQAAAMPLTYITAYEALVERLEIKKGEKAALLIVNGAGGVGAVASQIARNLLGLPVVVTTTSRAETTEFSRKMGATHTVNHREDIVKQIEDLKLDVPLRYVFITHSTTPYLEPAAEVLAPFGKCCSIVQTKEMDKMYGTKFMSKSLSFHWALIGTKPYWGVEKDSHGQILKELKCAMEEGKVKCHLTKTLRLTLEGLRKGHEEIEGGSSMGKLVLGVDAEGVGEAWM